MSRPASRATVAFVATWLLVGCSFQTSSGGDSDVVEVFDARRDGVVDAALTPDAEPGEIPVVHATYRAQGSNVDGRAGNDYNDAAPVTWYLNPSSGQYVSVLDYLPSMPATMRVIYNDDYVYFFISVTDDQREHQDSDPPNLNDSVMLYLDMDDELDGPVSKNDRRFLVDSGNDKSVFFGSGNANPISDNRDDYLKSSTRNETAQDVSISGYELRLNRSYNDDNFWPNGLNSVGFNVALYDDDGIEDPAGNLWFPDAYGLWFKSFAVPCANCCGAAEYPKAACDSTLLGRLVLDPPSQ